MKFIFQISLLGWTIQFHYLICIRIPNWESISLMAYQSSSLVSEASSTSTNTNIFLVRLCCSQHETDEEVILSRQTNSLVINQTLLMPHQDEPNSLVINQRVWFVLFVVNQSHRHIWLFGLSCLLSTNPAVIFGCLVCLVCYQPISPNYHHCFQKR